MTVKRIREDFLGYLYKLIEVQLNVFKAERSYLSSQDDHLIRFFLLDIFYSLHQLIRSRDKCLNYIELSVLKYIRRIMTSKKQKVHTFWNQTLVLLNYIVTIEILYALWVFSISNLYWTYRMFQMVKLERILV